jgi:hypothetical protein
MVGRPRSSVRTLVEHTYRIGISEYLKSLNLAEPPGPGSIASLTVSLDGRRASARVHLVTDRPNYGGVRFYFECPRCGVRVRNLHATESRPELACRRCHDLVYFVQYRKGAGHEFARAVATGDPGPIERVFESWTAARERGSRADWSLR